MKLYNGFQSRQVLRSAANKTIKQATVELLQSAYSATSAHKNPFTDLDKEEDSDEYDSNEVVLDDDC